MLKLQIKLAVRNLLRTRLTSSISLVSLAFTAICVQLIYIWIQNELKMDQFHEQKDNIYLTTVKTNPEADLTSISHQTMFRVDWGDFPEIEESLQLHVYNKGEIKFVTDFLEYEGRAFVVDSTFFHFFSFELLSGASNGILSDPGNILVTESFAKRVFNDQDPLGRTIEIRCDQVGTYIIAGIVKTPPSFSSIDFDFLIPRHSKPFWRRIPQEFVLGNSGFDLDEFNGKIAELGQDYPKFPESELSLVPFNDYYFEHPVKSSIFTILGDRSQVLNLGVIAFMIWLIALFGYSNLQSTQFLNSIKKQGIKQILGSTRSAIVQEIVISRLIMIPVAVGLSMLVLELIFPYYVSLFGLHIDRNISLDLQGILVTTFSISLISVLYSIYHIYSIKTNESVFQGYQPFRIPRMQRVLTILQYTVTIILLVATGIVYYQTEYMLNKDPGFNSHNVVRVNFFEMLSGAASREDREKRSSDFGYIRNLLSEQSNVISFSQGDLPIGDMANATSWKLYKEGEEYTTQNQMIVDPGYLKTLELQIIKGRFFSDSLDKNREDKVVINQAAAKYWGITEHGEFKLASNTSGRTERYFEVIGILKDYHYEHLSNKINPLVMQFRPYQDDPFIIKVSENRFAETLGTLEELYFKINPNGVFEYNLLSNEIEAQYEKEKMLGRIYLLLSLIALILSSLNMFAFSMYETERRTKEIGIRRVSGASSADIVRLLSVSMLRNIVIAFVIAVPVSILLLNRWLEKFAYRVDFRVDVLLAAGLVALLIGLISVIWQVLKLAKSSPVESLKTE